MGVLAEVIRRLRDLLTSEEGAMGAGVPRVSMPLPGTPAGLTPDELDVRPSSNEPVRVTCIDYCSAQYRVEEVADLRAFLAGHRPAWSKVRWINIDGLTQMDVIRDLAVKYELHPLAVEDVLHGVQRPKVEDYAASGEHPGRLFVVARCVEKGPERLFSEQLSMFMGRSTLLTFQEVRGDSFDPIRKRIQAEGSRIRENDVSFLLYALLDAIVDSYFPILEISSQKLEDLEDAILVRPPRETLPRIHAIKRELLLIRRSAWPMREMIAALLRDKHECLSETTQTFFRDVYDHAVQIIDLIETYREIASSLTETYMSAVSNRMNEIMKVLTIIGTIFIPLTFLAGVYGMNMPIPENHWWWSYPLFWAVCAGLSVAMLGWFRRRGWI